MIKTSAFSIILLAILLTGCKSSKKLSKGEVKEEVPIEELAAEEAFAEEEVMYEIIELKTIFGSMYIWLYDETPQHKANFLKLAKEGYYNGTTFHRIIDNFMIQGGDPNTKEENPVNVGSGGPGYRIPAEIKPDIRHKYGSVAAARDNNPQKASSGSQFYIVENKNGTPHLDGAYTVFGEVFKGFEVIDVIAEQPKDMRDKPKTDIKMQVNVISISADDLKEKYNFVVPE